MFTLPKLPYDYTALEGVISKKIMELHHDKHHAAYIAKANAALEGTEWADMPVEKLLQNLSKLPKEKQAPVKNNAGGHANHSLFWEIMRAPREKNEPTAKVRTKLEEAFGSFEKFTTQVSENAVGQFGSGWSWLVKKSDGTLALYATPNQDSPYLMADTPVMGVDVWEHAYYLDYLNDRAAYVQKWWQVVNWDEIEKRI